MLEWSFWKVTRNLTREMNHIPSACPLFQTWDVIVRLHRRRRLVFSHVQCYGLLPTFLCRLFLCYFSLFVFDYYVQSTCILTIYDSNRYKRWVSLCCIFSLISGDDLGWGYWICHTTVLDPSGALQTHFFVLISPSEGVGTRGKVRHIPCTFWTRFVKCRSLPLFHHRSRSARWESLQVPTF